MKKIIFSLLLVIFIVSAKAQDNEGFGFRLGLTASPTFGWIKQENANGAGFNLGFSYGMMGDFNFAKNYSFATELTVTSINGKIEAISTSKGTEHIKYKLKYIELPVTIKLKTAKKGKFRGYGQFGLSNGFNISAKSDDPLYGVKPGTSGSYSSSSGAIGNINLYRAGLIIGGGAEFEIDKETSLVGGLTLDNAFTNMTSSGPNMRIHYVTLKIGIFF